MPTWTTEGKCNTYVVSVQFLSEIERSLLFKASVITSVLGNWVWNLPLLKFQFLSFLPAFLSLKLLLLTHFLELLVSFQIQSTTVSSLLLYSPSLGGKQEKVFDMLPVCLLLYTLYFGFWDDREQGEKPGMLDGFCPNPPSSNPTFGTNVQDELEPKPGDSISSESWVHHVSVNAAVTSLQFTGFFSFLFFPRA